MCVASVKSAVCEIGVGNASRAEGAREIVESPVTRRGAAARLDRDALECQGNDEWYSIFRR